MAVIELVREKTVTSEANRADGPRRRQKAHRQRRDTSGAGERARGASGPSSPRRERRGSGGGGRRDRRCADRRRRKRSPRAASLTTPDPLDADVPSPNPVAGTSRPAVPPVRSGCDSTSPTKERNSPDGRFRRGTAPSPGCSTRRSRRCFRAPLRLFAAGRRLRRTRHRAGGSRRRCRLDALGHAYPRHTRPGDPEFGPLVRRLAGSCRRCQGPRHLPGARASTPGSRR